MTRKEDILISRVSASELPTEQSMENTETMLGSLDGQDDWAYGRIDDTYLSLNQFITVESSNYKVLINDNSYRMIVDNYNQDYIKVGSADLCNGDIFHIEELVKYLTITIYKYDNRQIVYHYNREIINDLKNGLHIAILRMDNLEEHDLDKELLTAEVHLESLSNYLNYRKGWYQSWGGQFGNMSGRLCTRNLYGVDDKPYVFNVNDSRIAISIQEYNESGKWIKYNGTILNGDVFIKQPSTAYIGITIRSLKWGVDLYALLKNGLRMDLSSNLYIGKTETISLRKADFSNLEHWTAGSYLYETGEFVLDPNKIRYYAFCTVDEDEYVVNLPGGYLKMSILELNQNGNVVKNYDLQSGQKWKKSQGTEKIGITVYGSGKTFTVADYKRFISAYPKFGLETYVKYSHNTHMKDITAGALINAVNVGWNLGNSLDSKAQTTSKTANLRQELNWGNPYITKDLVDYVATSGFNTIRIPVTWYYNTYKDADGTMRISTEWLNRVQDVVNYGIANGMYVILNTHHEQPIIYAGTNEDTMKQVLQDAQSLWNDIAEQFKTYDEHLLFESYNEVDNIERSWNYSDKAAGQMNELNQIFVDTVRSTGGNNSNRILVVPTLLDGADSRFYDAFQMPRDSVGNKIVVQIHTYSKKFNQDIESEFIQLQEFSNRISAPIIIGEFGSTPTYPFPELRTQHASNFVARAAAHGMKCVWWDNGSDYKIIDRRDFSNSNVNMIHALIEGSQGIAYTLDQGVVFHTIDQFIYRTPNNKTGKLENTYWGTLTTDVNGGAVAINEGTICSVSLKASGGASSVWVQRLLFYDEAGSLVQDGKEIQSRYYMGTIPEGAVTIRTSMNSPITNISLNKYKSYLENGEIELVIRCFDISDVKQCKLTVVPY